MKEIVNPDRVLLLKEGSDKKGPVVYWMQRDQRISDNWALLYAQEKALMLDRPLLIMFCLVTEFLEASLRQYAFMLEGLKQSYRNAAGYNIPFFVLTGEPSEKIPEFLKEVDASLLVSDFNPLKLVRRWKKRTADQIDIPFHQVDSHNIVPCWKASNKLEFAAYTIRPKIHKLLPEYLEEFPRVKRMRDHGVRSSEPDTEKLFSRLNINLDVPEVDWLKAGESEAHKLLAEFIASKLNNYSDDRNDPNKAALSNISPYLHFGHIAPQRVALEIYNSGQKKDSVEAYLEELIVRRELSDNFCYYNKNYDKTEGFPDWAKTTLREHSNDRREYIYTKREFEEAKTHDELWNAAQREMIKTGKMHGYMRMYWAKKILEWTDNPETALKTGIYLNDKYELDGRDPNGYAGLAWSIGGVHDRAWSEREVFGKIRYMNFNGCKRKFDVKAYMDKFPE